MIMNFFINKKPSNILTIFLSYLNIRYTDLFADKLFNEHPNKYNLLGCSQMLSIYKIKNTGIKFNNKENAIQDLHTPCIAHIGTDFVVIHKIESGIVHFWNKQHFKLGINDFCRIWTGGVLYAESIEKSKEPNYSNNYRKSIFFQIQKAIVIVALSAILTIVFIHNNLYSDLKFYLLVFLNLAGVYIGYLLVIKQLSIHSKYADKICSLFRKNDCNNILESDVAKLNGVIGWSEIGLGYFIANSMTIVCFPHLLIYVALINILTLPYTAWSIWYQRFKAKQWCMLCLIVQLLLWGIFFINILFGIIRFTELDIISANTLFVCFLYLLLILLINILVPNLGKLARAENIIQELNSIKADNNVFITMLKKQTYYEVDKNTSSILWGNKDADMLVTIFTNPHCNPCAKMHKRMENILTQSDNLCIQYIFSSFNDNLESSNKFLISTFFNKKNSERDKVFRKWFSGGQNTRESFFNTYSTNMQDTEVLTEFEKHKVWKIHSKITSTPTILVNGYKLPDNYKIEDLVYFSIN